MGQPLIPTNPAYQQQLNMAMQQQQNSMLRAQVGQIGGQLILSPRLATPVSQSQQQQHAAALMGMPPPMASSADAANAATSMLYNSNGATPSIPGFMAAAGQPTPADLSSFGLVNQTNLFDYPGSVDASAAGMSTNNLTFVKA